MYAVWLCGFLLSLWGMFLTIYPVFLIKKIKELLLWGILKDSLSIFMKEEKNFFKHTNLKILLSCLLKSIVNNILVILTYNFIRFSGFSSKQA